MKKSSDTGNWSDPFWLKHWTQWPACHCGTCDVAAVTRTAVKPMRFYCWEHRETGGDWVWMEEKDRSFYR